MRSRFLAATLLALVQSMAASAASPQVRAEIDALLARLQSSGCEFNRNGSWHSASDAKAHLLSKLEQLEGRSAVQSTEQFIDLAASTSSVTGTPYLVKCGSAMQVPSGTWLHMQLRSIRPLAGAASPAR